MTISKQAQNFLLISLLSLPSVAQRLNQTAITVCENTYGKCVGGLNETVTFKNCTGDFSDCMAKNAYMPSSKPLDCFRSQAAWDSTKLLFGATAVIFLVGYGLMPAALKAISKFINYTKLHCLKLNKCLLFFTDENSDGKVEPRELIQPTVLFSTISFLAFLPAWQAAIKAQAECDYAQEQKPQGD